MPTGVFVLLACLMTGTQQGAAPPADAKKTTAQAQPSAAEAAAARKRRAAVRAEAEKTVSGFAESKDVALKVAACEAPDSPLPAATCDPVLKSAKRSSVNVARVNDLAAKSAAGDAQAADELKRFTQELKDKDPAAAIEAVRSFAGTEGAEVLRELTASKQPEVRQMAAAALADKDPDQARELVKQAMTGKGPSDAGFQAAVGLAAAGDAEYLSRVSQWLPTLQGRDRFKAATALSKQQSADGIDALTQIARSGDDEMLRLEAAASLVEINPAAAAEAVSRGLQSENMWVRAEAASIAPRLGDEWIDRVKALLTDPNEYVRLRAAAAVLKLPAATPRK
jgi:hypothetical protein